MTITEGNVKGEPRHQRPDQRTPGQLAFLWLFTFRWHLLALFLSDLGRSVISRKYDAFTTDNGYSDEPVGDNPVTRAIDAVVRGRDTHIALRQRLDLVTEELVATTLSRRGSGPVRLVSGPVGLGRDLRGVWNRLERLGSRPVDWLEVTGIDLDASGTVLAEASRLARNAGIPLETYQQDMLDAEGLGRVIGGKVDVFNTIGLSTWLDQTGLEETLGAIRSTLAADGVLVVDHWRHHLGSKYVDALEVPARYISDEEFESTLTSCGYVIEDKRVTTNSVVVVYRARPD
jgi:SAM-dependent methyltransferase